MKAIAAVSIRQYENAVVSLAEHSRILEMGLQVLMINQPNGAIRWYPKAPQRLGIVVFGSDQGMCGRFNQQLADYTLDQIQKGQAHLEAETLPKPKLLVVGARIADSLRAADLPVEQCLSVPGSAGGITSLVQTITLRLESWQQTHQADQIWIIHNRLSGGAAPKPTQLQLFPLSLSYLQTLRQRPWPSRCRPHVTLNSDQLFSALFQQHFFISLYRACAESLASENASRLASMRIAEKNIEERLFDFKAAFQQQRQDEITKELLDIVSGFEALGQNR